MTKKLISIALLTVFMMLTVTEAEAQRRSKKRSTDRSERSTERSSRRDEDTEKISLKDRITYDIMIGNVGFNQGFQFSGKFAAGYKPIERLTLGAGLKPYYEFVNLIQNPNQPSDSDYSLFSYGIYPYARFLVAEQFYLKGEYNFFSYDSRNSGRISRNFPLVGGGYASGFGPWKFGIEVLFAVSNEGRDNYTFIEYMVSFMYNL